MRAFLSERERRGYVRFYQFYDSERFLSLSERVIISEGRQRTVNKHCRE